MTDTLFDGFAAEQELTQALLLSAVRRTVPLATTMSEDIARLRIWAKDRTRPASGMSGMSASRSNGRRVAA